MLDNQPLNDDGKETYTHISKQYHSTSLPSQKHDIQSHFSHPKFFAEEKSAQAPERSWEHIWASKCFPEA